MTDLDAVTAWVADSSTISGLLDASFEAFEFIRQVARECEDRVPELFAAFMVAAGTAVEGRNALSDAPSLPPARRYQAPSRTLNLVDVGRVADELAGLAGLLVRRLTGAAARSQLAGDREACERASQAAAGIHQILGRGADATAPG